MASKMKVGDRVTGNAALNATTATVVSLDSTYAFTLSEAVAIADGLRLDFSNRMNYSWPIDCLLYTSPSPRDLSTSRMPSSA